MKAHHTAVRRILHKLIKDTNKGLLGADDAACEALDRLYKEVYGGKE